ncbi:DUF5009 domain-containing protein [Sphingomonas sp. HITSZ_GF]|uniref:acyltransferase family protein n=1 Tax=Sphingomonas sp. HITSZ_GF TaxID=3037247 RepID=UPI00240E86EF|nr:DUF5009 domain-containing protein [Sphingomonas sp. HITSZ_GF]MDG2534622.1 DUF5009 domain-containing protein [Sphingomonas sp. HITSZ_GF]
MELDVLRGLAVAGMILVVSPGDWGAAYAPLRHAEWDGWTLADMVFPTFLFSVGAALGLSFPRPFADSETRRAFWLRVGRRVAALILLGLVVEASYNLYLGIGGGGPGHPGLENVRLPGVLQRIALCYLLGVVAIVATGRRDDMGRLNVRAADLGCTIAAVLIGYWALLMFVPVPGYGAGRLDPEGNLGAWIDRAIFTVPHLWPLGWATPNGPIVYDPEGLLSTLPAATNTLLGVLAGQVWRNRPERAPMLIGAAGALLLVAGLALDPVFVINKRIWTSSFALLSSGFSALVLAALMLALRQRAAAIAAMPFRVLGANAILAFVVATLLGRLYGLPLLGGATPQATLNGIMLALVGEPYFASFLCAVLVCAIVVALLWPLQRRGFHFRL